ncbi:MAG: T9SS type A sorting domain-containing protein, partial [Calditrichaeota bacterium]|nr:T9SS type A sorting domain-containing protein [Calditrichota bacterium]
DGGASWTLQSGGTTTKLLSVAFSDADHGIAAGNDGIIIRTSDGGASWTHQSSGTNSGLLGVSCSDANTGTVVGAEGTILRTYTGGVVALEEHQSVEPPQDFALYQNYPNPFNPVTVISYQLSVVSDVVLTVYDLLGRKVRTLVAERQAAGLQSVLWDGSDQGGRPVSSGLYIYRMQAGPQVQSRKMLLIR